MSEEMNSYYCNEETRKHWVERMRVIHERRARIQQNLEVGSIPISSEEENALPQSDTVGNEVKEVSFPDKRGGIISETLNAVIGHELIEEVYDPNNENGYFVTNAQGNTLRSEIIEHQGKTFRPKVDDNIMNYSVLLPEDVDFNCDPVELLENIIEFIKRYLVFERSEDYEVAARYVIFTWVYDRFTKIPYLRVASPFGQGKSRFLDVMKSICYHGSKLGVAFTTPNIFRWIQDYPGTLLLDEVRIDNYHDNKDLVDILNCGNDVNSSGVHRQKKDSAGNHTSVVYNTFCPKIIASRNTFLDDALESRILDITLKQPEAGVIFPPLPIIKEWKEAINLRNRLLGYRFIFRPGIDPSRCVEELRYFDPREYEILTPLVFSTYSSHPTDAFLEYAKTRHSIMSSNNRMSLEGEILQAIVELYQTHEVILLSDIHKKLIQEKIILNNKTSRYVGRQLRGLGLTLEALHNGVTLIDNLDEVKRIGEKYGIE